MPKRASYALSKPIGSNKGGPDGSTHILVEPVGPLSAGNDFNWWNLIVLKSKKTVDFERRGCYAIYVAEGGCDVFFLGSGKTKASNPDPDFKLSSTGNRQAEKAGYYSLSIKNTSTESLVAFVLLGVDPGTTPPKSSPSPSPR